MGAPSSGGEESHFPALDSFRNLGGNALHLHGEGEDTRCKSETGQWLRENGIRYEFFLCTQICHEGWNPETSQPIVRFSSNGVKEDIESDLCLIGTEWIDLVYLDDNAALPFEPVLDRLSVEIACGRVRAIGLRNWGSARLEAAHAYIKALGLSGFAAVVTTELSLLRPKWPLWPEYLPFDHEFSQTIERLGLAVFAHVGDLTSGQTLFGDEDPIACFRPEWVRRWETDDNRAMSQRIVATASKLEITTREVSVAWALNKRFPTIGIVGLSDFVKRPGQYVRASQLDADLLRELERA